MRILKHSLCGMFVILIISGCGQHYTNPYKEQSRQVTAEEISQYLSSICLELGGHIGLTAIGHCGQCGGMTPCCNMRICGACAAARGVCPFCMKKVDWTRNTDPESEIPILLAILDRSENLKPRQVAIHALTQINEPQTLDLMMKYSDEQMLSRELAVSIGVFADSRYIGYLKKVLQSAGDDYFGNEDEIERQYYLSNAAQAAAGALAKMGTGKAVNILLRSAEHGKLWERCYAIGALGGIDEERVRQALGRCLTEFFGKDSDWKWIPGRDLIGATLASLSRNGDRETALLVIHWTRNPGCDFLYDALGSCLSSIGKPALPDLIAAIREDLNSNLYDWGRLVLVETLGNIGDPQAIPFLIGLLDWPYPDQWIERDFKEAALRALGQLAAPDALEKIEVELFHGKEESTRYAAATALGLIGGVRSFAVLEAKLGQQDAPWVERECLASLNKIAFDKTGTDDLRLKAARITAVKGGAEAAFQVMYESVINAESWAVDFFFENLAEVPMQRNFHDLVELLDTNNDRIFTKTTQYLKNITKLKTKMRFNDAADRKYEFKQTLWSWYQEHYSELQ